MMMRAVFPLQVTTSYFYRHTFSIDHTFLYHRR